MILKYTYEEDTMFKNISGKVLRVVLFTSLAVALVVAATAIYAMYDIRWEAMYSSETIGEVAGSDSKEALLNKTRTEMIKLAEDKSALVDEKLLAIQNHTTMVADFATQIYTNPEDYLPRNIDYLQESDVGNTIPHIRTAPDISLDSIKDEVYLAANVQDLLSQITNVDTNIAASYIGSESGFFITVDKNAAGPHNTGYDPTTRGWYIGAKENDGAFWTDIFMDSAGRGASISCAVPFYDMSGGGKVFKGAAGSGALLTDVSEIVSSTKVAETGYAFILNEYGQIVISPRDEDIMITEDGSAVGVTYLTSENEALVDLATRMRSGKSGIKKLTMDEQEVYAAYHPLETLAWSIAIIAPVEEVISEAEKMNNEIITLTSKSTERLNSNIFKTIIAFVVLFVVANLIMVFIAYRFSKRLVNPILKLNEGVREISGGNLDSKIYIKTDDEIEELADSFNTMTGELKTYMQDLTKVTADKERIATELDVATNIQASMLPCIFPAFPERKEFDIFASMNPAKEVGGDFYDFFLIDDNTLAIVMADVSGKGVPAALFMVIAKTLIKNNAQAGLSPTQVFETVNNLLCENNDAGMFVTAFMGYVDIPTGRFTYVNAGHNPPLLRNSEGKYEWLPTSPGFVLAGMDGLSYKQDEVVLSKSEVIFMYTDGVTEATNVPEELYSEERLLKTANEFTDKNPMEFVACIKADIDKFAEGAEQADDITMLSFEYEGEA